MRSMAAPGRVMMRGAVRAPWAMAGVHSLPTGVRSSRLKSSAVTAAGGSRGTM